MKTKVKIIIDDDEYKEFKKGEVGYIDGYIRAADNRPYACVVIEDRIVMISLYSLRAIGLFQL